MSGASPHFNLSDMHVDLVVHFPCIGIGHEPTSRPSTKRPCNPSRCGDGESSCS
jgi:hypothetical protein